jgi:LDH2 family malate/lactate/ureidoglycolate dehydrogenase
VVRESGATAVIDGNYGFAQLALTLAKKVAAEKASTQGVALVTVRKCCWFGALGPYLHSLTEQGYMAQLWAQTTTCRDAAPYGGIDAKFSTNPIAMAYPTKRDPVISDFSTTTISMGKTKRMAQNNQQAPEPIFLDAEGNLSSDPKIALEGGSVLFLGGAHFGYKGYGLSLWAEGIAALAGGECNNPESTTSQSASLTVIDPKAFAGEGHYYDEIERFKRHMLKSRVRPGYDNIRLPGQRLMNNLRESEQRGIAVEEELLETLNTLAQQQGIALITAD